VTDDDLQGLEALYREHHDASVRLAHLLVGNRARAEELAQDAFVRVWPRLADADRFYERLGWERWQGPTFVRRGEALVRTEEEDDGIMVLRPGPGVRIDLRASISCEARAGDDW
jgi:hypothetical protein